MMMNNTDSINSNNMNNNNNDGGVPLLIDDAHDATISENISKNPTTTTSAQNNNNNNNNNQSSLSPSSANINNNINNMGHQFSKSATRFSGSDEFANEQMYNSYEQQNQQALMYLQQGQNTPTSQKNSNNNNTVAGHQHQQQQQQHHHQFIPNNHPSVSPFETNLFVAGLPPGTDDEKLASYFTKFGKIVSARVLVDLVTHSLRNYGFVKFETRDAAEKAINEMNEFRVTPHQILHVTWATHREDAPQCDTLYVRNLPDNVTRQDLNNYFAQYGEVRELSLPRCAPFRGVCFVRYKTVEEARKALNGTHNSTPFGNRALQVRYKAPSKKIPPGTSGGSGSGSGGASGAAQQQQQQIISGNNNGGGFTIQATGSSSPPPQPGMISATGGGGASPMFTTAAAGGGIQQQQQQFVQVIGPNGQIQLVPQSMIQQQQQPHTNNNNNSSSANSSISSHPLQQQQQQQNMMYGNNSRSPHTSISPGSSMEGQQFIQQTLPNGQQVLVMAASGSSNSTSNSGQQQQQQQQQSSTPPTPTATTANNFPAQGDLCFFNVSDDNELMRYLTASFGQVAVSRRTPEGALLVRLFNSQQHDFCAKTLNGKALAQGQPSLTVGLVGFQPK